MVEEEASRVWMSGGVMGAPNVGIPGAYNMGNLNNAFNNAYSNFNVASGRMPTATGGVNLQTPTGGSLF